MAKSNPAATVVAVVVTLVIAGAGGYMLGARSQRPEAKVVASVNGKDITQTALYDRLAAKYGGPMVSQMIDDALVDQAAKAAGVNVTAADVDADIQKIRESIGGDDKLQAALAQYSYTLDELKAERATQMKLTRILSKDLKVEEADLKKYFDENQSRFDKREVKSRHILLNTEEEAKAVREELATGADFATLAKAKSIDPTAQQNGGDLGFNTQGKMVAEYDKVVFSMKKGEISAPFKTEFGWHVVEVLDITGTAPNFEAQKADVREAYIDAQVQPQMQPWVEEQRAKAKISNSFDKEAK